MSRNLDTFRRHARQMVDAEHAPDCPHITARKPFWHAWTLTPDGQSMSWNGPEPKWEPPPCSGCITDEDRAMWARLATEVDRIDGGAR